MKYTFFSSYFHRAYTSWYCQHCLITGVLDTSQKFIDGVVDTGEQFLPVSLTPAINFRLLGYFWPVSTTPGNSYMLTRAINCCDDRGPFFLHDYELRSKNKDSGVRRQQYLRPPGSDVAADGVIGTTMKRGIHRHLTHPNQSPLGPLRPPKTKTALSLTTKVGHSRVHRHPTHHDLRPLRPQKLLQTETAISPAAYSFIWTVRNREKSSVQPYILNSLAIGTMGSVRLLTRAHNKKDF
jgi:hypothetical protein